MYHSITLKSISFWKSIQQQYIEQFTSIKSKLIFRVLFFYVTKPLRTLFCSQVVRISKRWHFQYRVIPARKANGNFHRKLPHISRERIRNAKCLRHDRCLLEHLSQCLPWATVNRLCYRDSWSCTMLQQALDSPVNSWLKILAADEYTYTCLYIEVTRYIPR